MSHTAEPTRPEAATDTGPPAARLHVFRVEEGLGNACLVIFPDDTCAVVDWGTTRQAALDNLFETIEPRKTLRFVAATHVHKDHTQGLPSLLEECRKRDIEICRFVYPATSLPVKKAMSFKEALLACERCGIKPWEIGVDTFEGPDGMHEPPHLAWGKDPDWEVRLLAPPIPTATKSEVKAVLADKVTGNETSFVVLFRFSGKDADGGQGRLLLPGDATAATLGSARDVGDHFPHLSLDSQAVLIPHHGSQYNMPDWLDPYVHGLAIVSAETDSEHHPHEQVLERLCRLERPTGEPHVFCTSYAGLCRREFAGQAPAEDEALVRPGCCFGDIVVSIPESGPAHVVQASAKGEMRRPYGRCGNPG